MERWQRRLSPAARAVWGDLGPGQRDAAELALRDGAVVDDPSLALVVGEMQLATHGPTANRWLRLLTVAFAVYVLFLAIVETPWWLLALAGPGAAVWEMRRSRPAIGAGIANLRRAESGGHPIALRYAERFADWERIST